MNRRFFHNPLLKQKKIYAMKKTLLLWTMLFLAYAMQGQDGQGVPTPKTMIEIGVHGGLPSLSGEVDPLLGYGFGLSVRKSIDYLISLRAEGFYGKMEGATRNLRNADFPNGFDRTFTTDIMTFNVVGILNLNSMRFDRPVRKTNIYFLAGAGVNRTRVNYSNERARMGFFDWEISTHTVLGAGLAFRLNPKVNIGVEHQVGIIVGPRADLLDGVEFNTIGEKSAFGDIFNYTNVRVNFNLGDAGSKSEPLYWLNPIQMVLDDLGNKKSSGDGEALEIVDSDDDGVIDLIDKEPNTPADALVDTKGRTLDSDRDGVPDHIDKQPYYTPMAGERITSEGVVENPIGPGAGSSGAGISESRVREIIAEEFSRYENQNPGSGISPERANQSNTTNVVTSMTDFFLPMIHFGSGSNNIKYSDYGTLASIARLLQGNKDLRIAVIGHADQTGDEGQNDLLSYDRALSVVAHLLDNYGIDRERILLMWRGQTEPLVPSTGSFMNRRVEFRVAASNEVEMEPPASTDGGDDGY